MKKKKKIVWVFIIISVMIFLVAVTSFLTIFLYINCGLNFLAPLYNLVAQKKEVSYYIPTEDNLGLYYEAVSLEPELRVRNSNKGEFLEWQSEAKQKLKQILGMENNGKLDSKIRLISKKNIGSGVERYKINFTSYDGVQIPCYLFLHTDNKKRPGIAVISGHGRGIIETAGIVQSDQNGNAEFLAKNGYVTITCENRGFGFLNRLHYNNIQANAIAVGRSYQGVILDDHMQAVSVLQSIKQVDKEKIGAAGVSLGGEQAMYLAAIDERIKAAVVMGWLSNYEVMLHNHSPDWAVPSLLKFFDQESIGSLIVPTPVLYGNGKDEKGPGWFNTEDALKTMEEIKKSYALFNSEEKVIYKEHPGGHVFDNKDALEFFNQHLKS